MQRYLNLGVLVALWLAMAPTGRAELMAVDRFDALALGDINAQNLWHAPGGSSVVALDPSGGTNQVLAITTNSTLAYKSLLIPNLTSGTLFARFRFTGQLTYSFGMAEPATPDLFGDLEAEVRMANAANDLWVNNDGQYDPVAALAPAVWYNLWMWIDGRGDTLALYLHDTPGALATAGDQLPTVGPTAFDFRDGTAGDLRTFFIKTAGGSSQNVGPLYLDDLYFDAGGTVNLANPVPEPAALTGLGAGFLALARRHRQ